MEHDFYHRVVQQPGPHDGRQGKARHRGRRRWRIRFKRDVVRHQPGVTPRGGAGGAGAVAVPRLHASPGCRLPQGQCPPSRHRPQQHLGIRLCPVASSAYTYAHAHFYANCHRNAYANQDTYAYTDGHGHCYLDGYPYCYGYANSYAYAHVYPCTNTYRHGNAYAYARSYCHGYSNSYRHGNTYVYTDSHSNAYGYANTDANSGRNAAGPGGYGRLDSGVTIVENAAIR